ncbi:hypothetical protein NQU49_25845, partial [Escherichia coli]|uniref:2-oxoglutarate dehydrogenase E1 subunit family protein n=1 Tax=Escherichia coli TaxID=562 RepID=UPI0021197B29
REAPALFTRPYGQVSVMNDQSPNSAFRDTSFLQGANAAYVEQLYGQWAKDPAAVDHAWDEYFRSLGWL